MSRTRPAYPPEYAHSGFIRSHGGLPLASGDALGQKSAIRPIANLSTSFSDANIAFFPAPASTRRGQ